MQSSAWRKAVDSNLGIGTDTEMRKMGGGAGAKRRVGWQEGCVEQAQGQADAVVLSAHSTSPKRPRLEPSDTLNPHPPPGEDGGSGIGGRGMSWSSGARNLSGRSEIMQCGDAQVCGCGCGCGGVRQMHGYVGCVDDSHNLFLRRIDQTVTVRVTCQHSRNQPAPEHGAGGRTATEYGRAVEAERAPLSASCWVSGDCVPRPLNAQKKSAERVALE